ncbi:MAG: hypothetical protein GX025_10345 [Clostridiales bacterium]|nr:hypothetical protein [Clostridiales bacterium]
MNNFRLAIKDYRGAGKYVECPICKDVDFETYTNDEYPTDINCMNCGYKLEFIWSPRSVLDMVTVYD